MLLEAQVFWTYRRQDEVRLDTWFIAPESPRVENFCVDSLPDSNVRTHVVHDSNRSASMGSSLAALIAG
jgi:hypothetical protein